ncbi:hypothetical protein PybrP1_003652 [[Pythium] brassicae (nom. inval.)]|nr:hypothetical protein PybrP1_003652 [[Pythium] brassicae (nom. inval.)]
MASRGVRASIDFSGPLNALSTSPNNRFVAVGGRDVLKVVALETAGFAEKRNLRVGKASLNFSTNDIRWHPHADSVLATAATNGAVVIWNLQREGFKHVQERVLTGHRRAVNRICWHTTDWNVLISGSQDGTIKIWDKRGKVTNTYQPKSESVRDVRMSPFDPHRFAAAFENGIVQVWDIRKNAQPQLKFTAHKGLVLALDWHPTRPHVLASGGRDRYVKIWDLDDLKQPKQTIQTIASVGRVLWRPNCPDHIATSASLMDNSVHVWDVQRPFIPIASMKGHADIASGLAWMDTPTSASFGNPELVSEWDGHNYWQHMLACSKDGTLKLHSLADSFKMHQSLPTTALALNSKGQMAFSHDFVDRTCASLKIHRYESAASALFTVAPDSAFNERRASASPFGSHGSDRFDDAADLSGGSAQQQQMLKSGRIFPAASQATPPLPPKASIGRTIGSSGNFAAAASAGGGLTGASNHRSLGSMGAVAAAGAGGIVRHSAGNTSQSNLQSLQGGSNSGNSLATSLGVDGAFDNRRALHYANQPSSSGSHSVTSSPALTFLSGSVAPSALVSLVSMQGAAKASQLERIFRGDGDEYSKAQQELEAMRAQFAYGQQLKESFGFDEDSFRFLAKQYVLFSTGKVATGDSTQPQQQAEDEELSFVQMCAHNALAAFVTGNARLSQMWRILQVLYESEAENAPSALAASHDVVRKDAGSGQKYDAPPEPHHPHHALHRHYIAETRSEDSTSVLSMDTDDHSHHNDGGGLVARRDARHGDEFAHHGGGSGANPSQTMMLLEQLDHVNPQAMHGFDPYPYDSAGRGNAHRDPGSADRVGGGSGGGGGARTSKDASPSSSPMIVHGNAVHGELSQLHDAVLKELLEYYADVGDLQTCVAVAVVVSKVANVENVMGKSWLQQIYMHYIDLLHQLRIYSAANELVANCSDQSIRQMNMKSTTVYFNCGGCSKPFESYLPSNANGEGAPAALCSHCRNRATRCSICQLPVRGLYVWCPVCSHGGHLEHLADWFDHEDVCPTGCSHRCSLNLVTSMDLSDRM